jgi:hypothetical protein
MEKSWTMRSTDGMIAEFRQFLEKMRVRVLVQPFHNG